MSKTLHLNLIRKWFDKVYKRFKLEEYREVKPYWCSRFCLWKGEHKSLSWWKKYYSTVNDKDAFEIDVFQQVQNGVITLKHFDTITFSNGMTPPVPRFEMNLNSMCIGTGVEEWGAEKGVFYFVFKLGKILNHGQQAA